MVSTTNNRKADEPKYKCTACGGNIKPSSFEVFLHPLLKCLICRRCHTDYGNGDFAQFNDPEIGPGVDENGDDNYCRWCVDGGDLFACGNGELDSSNRCHYAFCTECIKRNCPDDEVLSQENFPPEADVKWECFACNPSKLRKLRQEAQEVILALSTKDLQRNPIVTSSMGKDKETDEEVTITSETPVVSKDKENSRARDKESCKEQTNGRDATASSNDDSQSSRRRRAEPQSSQNTPGVANKAPGHSPDEAQPQKKRRSENGSSNSAEAVPKEPVTTNDDPPTQKKRKADSANSSVPEQVQKEPEASLMPPVAPPKPPESALRRLSKKSAIPEAPKNLLNRSSAPDTSASTPLSSTPTTSVPLPSTTSSSTVPSSSASSTTSAQPKSFTRTLPSSINPVNPKVKLPNAPSTAQEVNKPNSSLIKSRPLSKQLKSTNETIRPSCKVPLTEMEMKKRLDNFGLVKDNCIKEIESKFQNILEMFRSKDMTQNKAILKFEIDDIEKPLQEISSMVRDLKSLYFSQN